MSNETYVVDVRGDIRIHKRGGVRIPVTMKDVDDVDIDLSARSLYFEIKGVRREPLEQDPSNPLGRVIVLTKDEIALLPLAPTEFALIDESGEVFDVLWSGKITGYGW